MKNKVNEIKVSYQENSRKSNTFIKCSKDTAKLLFNSWNKDTIYMQESFKMVLLNNAHKVKGIYEISSGGITGTLVDLRIVFAVILKTLSVSIILVHNHPSGMLKPSISDKKITEKIKTASEYFDIKLLDHIILSPEGTYYSFADECIL